MSVVRLASLLLIFMVLVPAPHAQPLEFPRTKLHVETATGGRFPFSVELADTPRRRQQGLMFRNHLPDDGGMLFLFDRPYIASFWMRTTFISLEIIFVTQDGRIVNIHERAVPGSNAVISSAAPVKAVLEVKGGTAARLGIKPGDRVVHPSLQ